MSICAKYGCDFVLDMDGQVTCTQCGAFDDEMRRISIDDDEYTNLPGSLLGKEVKLLIDDHLSYFFTKDRALNECTWRPYVGPNSFTKACSYCDKLSYTSKVVRDGSKIYYCDNHSVNIAVD